MNAYTFRRHDASREQVSNPKGFTSTRRTLRFHGKHIILSDLLSQQLGVKSGAHLAFTYDEDHPDRIYVRTADSVDDTRDIQCLLSQVSKDKPRLRCTNSAVVRHVLQQVGASKSCTCYVAPIVTNINKKDHYQILVSCPILIH